MKYKNWAFIRDLQNEVSLVALENSPQPKKFYWDGGPSHCYMDSGFEILR